MISMTFINNRLDFFNGESYGEVQHANAFAKGMPNFVAQGLELTGNILSSGIFNNTGTFGQLGSVNETHTITANYTGFIVIESTLSGRTSTSRIIESPTFLSTDPRTASSVRHFTIYELSNGSIVNDFRHIDYVKSFEVRNVGGNQFVFVLNGFVSAPFDASVLAGNRTLINDIDINYDDTIHAITPIEDILKDLFDKSQSVVGADKPFILTFNCSSSPLNLNLKNAINSLILNEYGKDLSSTFSFNFKMETSTLGGYVNSNYANNIKCIVWSREWSFEFEFDYDNWSNVIVRDAAGYTTANYIEDELDKLNQLTTATPLYTGNATMNADIILNESIYNFARADIVYSDRLTYCGVSTGTNIVNGTYNAPWGENGIFMIAGASIISSDGLTLSKYGDNHSRNIVIRGGDINDVDTEGNIGSVYGLLRKHPLGTVWNVIREDDKFYRIGILNDEIREKVIISQQQYLEVLSSNKK